MSRTDYDIVVLGGGLGGAAFAAVMAKAGARVLVVERETRFQDRVRGEFMEPWGVAETRGLRISTRSALLPTILLSGKSTSARSSWTAATASSPPHITCPIWGSIIPRCRSWSWPRPRRPAPRFAEGPECAR